MSQNRRDTLDSWIPVQTWVVVAPARETQWHCRTFLISTAQSDWKGIQKLLLKQNKNIFQIANGRTSGTSKNHTIFANKGCTKKFFSKQKKLTKTMASSNHQQRPIHQPSQYISLCNLELHNFKHWLNRQNPENIKASLMSVIDHDTNEVHCHVNINWSPNTPDQDTFPIHFRDMRKSTVLLPGTYAISTAPSCNNGKKEYWNTSSKGEWSIRTKDQLAHTTKDKRS